MLQLASVDSMRYSKHIFVFRLWIFSIFVHRLLIFGKEAWTFILALWLDLAELGAFPDSTSYLVFPFCFCYVPSPL